MNQSRGKNLGLGFFFGVGMCANPLVLPWRKDADGRVTGGRDLASTAKYPVQFCARIFALWYVEFDKMSSKDWHP